MFSISQSLTKIMVYFLFFYFTRFDAAFLHITTMKRTYILSSCGYNCIYLETK